MPTLESEELSDDDLLDIALHMVAYLLNHLETHRGPSPMTILMPLFSDQHDAMLALPEFKFYCLDTAQRANNNNQPLLSNGNKDKELMR